MSSSSFGVALATAMLLHAAPLMAHDGHDHNAPPPPARAAPRAEAVGDALQATLIRGPAGDALLYLDRRADNAPVSGAVVSLDSPTGGQAAAVSEIAPGLHRLTAPWLAQPGDYELVATVVQGGEIEILPLSLRLPPAAASGGALWEDRPERTSDGGLFIPKSLQRLLALQVAAATPETTTRAVAAPARLIPDPNASGVVASAVAGRLSPPPGGFPTVGRRVKAGDPLAVVHLPLQAVDSSDMHQRGGELDQQIATYRRRLERLRSLGDVAARSQVEETEIELRGLEERRRRLGRARDAQEVLTAPVDGVIAAASAVAGAVAEPNAPLFLIVDPQRWWAEVYAFAPVQPDADATARTLDGRALTLRWRGSGRIAAGVGLGAAPAGLGLATPVYYAVDPPAPDHAAALVAHQRLVAYPPQAERRFGAPLPRAAVVRSGDGRQLVFEQLGPERFLPRMVDTAPLDADRLLVVAGVTPGAKIVVQGAELLRRVR